LVLALLKTPQAAVHAAPPCVSFHVTAVFEVLVTVAVNCCVAPPSTVGVGGATEIVTAGTVIVAEFDLVVSDTDVAVMVTVSVLVGGVDGAV
jgi:hypothetical protein